MAQFMAQLAKLVRVSPGVGAAFPLEPRKDGLESAAAQVKRSGEKPCFHQPMTSCTLVGRSVSRPFHPNHPYHLRAGGENPSGSKRCVQSQMN